MAGTVDLSRATFRGPGQVSLEQFQPSRPFSVELQAGAFGGVGFAQLSGPAVWRIEGIGDLQTGALADLPDTIQVGIDASGQSFNSAGAPPKRQYLTPFGGCVYFPSAGSYVIFVDSLPGGVLRTAGLGVMGTLFENIDQVTALAMLTSPFGAGPIPTQQVTIPVTSTFFYQPSTTGTFDCIQGNASMRLHTLVVTNNSTTTNVFWAVGQAASAALGHLLLTRSTIILPGDIVRGARFSVYNPDAVNTPTINFTACYR